MKKLIAIFVAVLSVLILATPVSASQNEEEDKVTLCHATNSATNPYVKITVNESGANGFPSFVKADHGNHKGPIATSQEVAQQLKDDKKDWGDIIPPFEQEFLPDFDGLNWTDEGQAILRNDCEVPEEEPKEDLCPNLEGVQEELPVGYKLDDQKNCVKEEEPVATPTPTPTTLPETGFPAGLLGLLGLSLGLGGGSAFLLELRELKKKTK